MKSDLGDVIRIRECLSLAEAEESLREGWELVAVESVDIPEDEGKFLRRLVYVFVIRAPNPLNDWAELGKSEYNE